ncbi:hypothetical protein AVEN_268770-1 [Araneus ventricosus]|uniref:Uncharacterized protein n=1 Tax=Araneus ventricosus TaxID=182803 RepID=A0A4Y2K826_ARAVE|nr:hypothetical protein AVEN_268770-1 [Araneus ventricosus]
MVYLPDTCPHVSTRTPALMDLYQINLVSCICQINLPLDVPTINLPLMHPTRLTCPSCIYQTPGSSCIYQINLAPMDLLPGLTCPPHASGSDNSRSCIH